MPYHVLNASKPRDFFGSFRTIVAVALLTILTTVTAQGQDETSSRRETEAIKKIEENGGRVYRISAADSSREVSFYLSSKPIGDEQINGVNAIGEVIWVNLAGTEITNDGLKHLAGLPLTKLHLERTKIGDDGLKHLKSFKELTYLNIYDTQVTDAGLEHLKELKKLKKLFVWKSAVTDAGIKKLNQTLPNLEIVGELKLEPVVIEEPKKEETEKPKKAVDEDKKAKPDQPAAKKNQRKRKNRKKAESTKSDAKKNDDKKGESKKDSGK